VAGRLPATRAAIVHAEDRHRQAIRDAKTAGMSIVDIAATLGMCNRRATYAALNSQPPAHPPEPQLSPVIYRLFTVPRDTALFLVVTQPAAERRW